MVGGLIIAVGSLLLGVLPGPGTLTFFLGLGMIAGEFRPVARLLDLGGSEGKEVESVGQRCPEVICRREGAGRLGGRDLRRCYSRNKVGLNDR